MSYANGLGDSELDGRPTTVLPRDTLLVVVNAADDYETTVVVSRLPFTDRR